MTVIKKIFTAQGVKKILLFLALATLAIILGQLVAIWFLKSRFTI